MILLNIRLMKLCIFIASLTFLSSCEDKVVPRQATAFEVPRSSMHTLKVDRSNRAYDLYVKVPPGYSNIENSDQKYPVIYLNDGPYTFQVASGATRLPIGAKKIEPVILVGISFAKGESGVSSRVLDFTPVEDASWKKYQTGGASEYFEFLSEQVVPLVEEKYRADPKRRTLSGQSLGGSFGAWVLLERPGVFSSYILTSPSLWFKDRYIFDVEESYAEARNDLAATVYFAVGSEETLAKGQGQPMVSQLEEFTKTLKSRDYPSLNIKSEVIPEAIHETTFPQGFIRGSQWIYSTSELD